MKLLWAVMLGWGLAAVAGADEKTREGSYAGEVTASKLMLRAGPAETYQPVATLDGGERVVVLGKQAHDPQWLAVEVPGGYHAWVYGRFLSLQKDGTARATTSRLLVRPRATTKYHHLSGRLNKGEVVKVVGKKETAEGLWYRIVVPRRFPLYAHARFVKNIGPAEMAEPKRAQPKPAPGVKQTSTPMDRRFKSLEKVVLVKLPAVRTASDIQPLRRALMELDRNQLSLPNRTRHVDLLGRVLKIEREVVIKELTEREKTITGQLQEKLAEIERRYEEKLRAIRSARKPKKPRYTATGIVAHGPDLLGRYPDYRLEKGKRMRFYLIAPDYDLGRFVGKRVGLIGLKDPESGTGFLTIMVKRIEILGDR